MILPYPPKELNPNKRLHWAVVMRAKKKYRADCAIIAKQYKPRMEFSITFHPPDKRRRDRDNIIAAFKAGQDALAEVWGVDDSEFVITYKPFGAPVKGGCVVIR